MDDEHEGSDAWEEGGGMKWVILFAIGLTGFFCWMMWLSLRWLETVGG